MEEVAVVGIDLAKSVFQVHGVDAQGQVVVRRRLSRSKLLAFFAEAAALPDRHGDLRQRQLLGAAAHRAGPRGAADAAAVCEALREALEERRF